MNFTISHNSGQYHINVSLSAAGYVATISDSNSSGDVTQVMIAESQRDLIYDRCREWASTNVLGEFTITELPDIKLSRSENNAA